MIPVAIAIFSILMTVSGSVSVEASQGSIVTIFESRYFTIKAFEGLNVTELLKKLNYDYFLQVDTFLKDTPAVAAPDVLLARNIDAIYAEVQTVLGLEVSAFHGTILICPDQLSVQEEFRKIYGMDFQERSFYVFDLNTIFISYQDLTLGMLGHEIAHAVISGYFVVPPPTKVQEVLAGYVEYSLRKATTR